MIIFTLSYTIILNLLCAIGYKVGILEKMSMLYYQQTNYISRLMVKNLTHRKVQYLHLGISFKARYKIACYLLFKEIKCLRNIYRKYESFLQKYYKSKTIHNQMHRKN